MRRLLLTACLLAGVAFGSTEVFRWVDEDGVVHFSDRPVEGAESVTLREAQTFSAPPVQPRSPTASGDDQATAFRYRALEIVNPGQEEVLWNIEGQLDVSMRLEPRLQPGHQVSLFLDDQRVPGLRTDSLRAQLTDVSRGTHKLQAEVRNPAGALLIQSQPRIFSVQQTSVLNPNNPNNRPIPTPLPGP